MLWTVYKHTNKINQKSYIGITSQSPPSKRWGNNGCNYKRCIKFYNAIQKYGWNNFTHEILFINLTQKEAGQKEKELIEYYDCLNNGYNASEGGFAPIFTDKHKKNISKSLKGRQFSQQHREHLSQIAKQRTQDKNPFYGKHHSQESKEKISQAHKNKKLTEEHKKKISQSIRKEKHPNWGKHLSQETKQKISKKIILCVETGDIFYSLNEAGKFAHLANGTHIGAVCRGQRKTAGGYHWKYLKEGDEKYER